MAPAVDDLSGHFLACRLAVAQNGRVLTQEKQMEDTVSVSFLLVYY